MQFQFKYKYYPLIVENLKEKKTIFRKYLESGVSHEILLRGYVLVVLIFFYIHMCSPGGLSKSPGQALPELIVMLPSNGKTIYILNHPCDP